MSDVSVEALGSPRVHIGDRVAHLDTLLVLADLHRMERNIRDWQAWMCAHGVQFRVKVKTHKVPGVAQPQLAAGARGILASDEAAYVAGAVLPVDGCQRAMVGMTHADLGTIGRHR